MIAYSIINALTGERVIGPLQDDEIPRAREVALSEKDRLTREARGGLNEAPHTLFGEQITYELEIVDHDQIEAEQQQQTDEAVEALKAQMAEQEQELQERIDAAVERALEKR